MKFPLILIVASLGSLALPPAESISVKDLMYRTPAQVRNPAEEVILKALEAVRVIMINGTENIPPLDPFYIDKLAINFTSPDAELLLNVKETLVTHLSEFVVEVLTVNMVRFTLDMELSLTRFNIDGQYAMDGLLLNLFPLYGAGNYYVHVQNVSLGGGAKLDLGVPPQIENLQLDFTFESLTVLFENLLGGGSLEALIETTINLLAKQVVDTVWAIIQEPFCQLIEDTINAFLANMTVSDLPAMLRDNGRGYAYLGDWN